jgi:hypothetical protein
VQPACMIFSMQIIQSGDSTLDIYPRENKVWRWRTCKYRIERRVGGRKKRGDYWRREPGGKK